MHGSSMPPFKPAFLSSNKQTNDAVVDPPPRALRFPRPAALRCCS